MSIIIRNVGGNPMGICQYHVYINDKFIYMFEHDRKDGLAACLKKASIAAEETEWMGLKELFGVNKP